MGYKSKLVRLLDHPGGRFILGGVATAVARRSARLDVRIAYIGGQWTRCIGAERVPAGHKFPYIPENFQQWREQKEDYAAKTRDFWLASYEPKAGDTIIDVGAGHGEDTLTFSRLAGPSGRVIAIEAHPLSFKALKNFCRLNRLSNVTPVHLALMDKPGEVRIIESQSWLENRVTSNGEPASSMTAPAGTLDDLCRRLRIGTISFLKMNIEGAERYALLGAAETIPRIRHICVSCHDFLADRGEGEHFRTRAFVEKFLSEAGLCTTRRADSRQYVSDQIWTERPISDNPRELEKGA